MQELTELAKEISKVRKTHRFSREHKRWQLRCLDFLAEVFGRGSLYFRSLAALGWTMGEAEIRIALIDRFQESCGVSEDDLNELKEEGYLAELEKAEGILEAAKDRLARATISEVFDTSTAGQETNAIMRILSVAQQDLRKAIRRPADKEIQIQDAFETLLIGAGFAYSRESVAIKYSSKTYYPDFTFDHLNLAVDLKLCRRQDREKAIIAEINDDILAYQKKYKNLLFIIYDIGRIRDVDRFLADFKKNASTQIVVVKH